MKSILNSITAYLHAPLAPEHRFASGLLLFAALRPLVVASLLVGVPPLEGRVPPWYFHSGGDQIYYYRLAEALARGQVTDEVVGVGAPLMMVPFVWLLGSSGYRDILAPLVIINGVILAGVSVVLTGLVGRSYTGDRRVGLLGAALWSLLPLPVYLILGVHPQAPVLRGAIVPKIMWLSGLPDGPAMFGVLLAVWALGWAVERHSLRAYFVAGLALGWAVMTRIQTAPVVATLLGVLLLMRPRHGLLWACVGGLVSYLPQAVVNTSLYGIPFYTGYLRVNDPKNPSMVPPLHEILSLLPYSRGGLVRNLADLVGRFPFLVWLLPLAGAAGVALVVVLWRRRGWPRVAILLGVPGSNIAAHVTLYFFQRDPVRFTMLAYPYLLVAGAFLFFLVWDVCAVGLAGGGGAALLPLIRPGAENT